MDSPEPRSPARAQPGSGSSRLILLAWPIALALALLARHPLRAQEAGAGPVYLPLVSTALRVQAPWPAHGEVKASPNTWLTWELVGAAPPGYRFTLYGEADDPSPDVALAHGLIQRIFDPPTLPAGRTFYWQVSVVGKDGRELVAGQVWSFRTLGVETPPQVNDMVDIPAGSFQMGCAQAADGGYGCRASELPLHTVYLDAYAIDRYEVTNREYRRCYEAGACDRPRRSNSLTRGSYYGNLAYDDYPVLFVSWWDATEFCAWEGKRLPTEAEWEKAARGSIDVRPWPWGSETIDCDRANFTDNRVEPWILCVGDTDRVGMRPLGASPYGVLDMAGNVFEWVYDQWDTTYYPRSPYENPRGPDIPTEPGDVREFVIRGGSYRPNWFYARAFNRHWGHHGDYPAGDLPWFRNNQVGFRCAKSLP